MARLTVLALRVLVVLLALGTLAAQTWFIPGFAEAMADDSPELAYLAVPYTVLWIAIVACVQVAFVAVWALLSKVQQRAIFVERALRWVDAIIVAAAVATVLVAVFEFHVLGIVDVGPPVLGVVLTGVVIAGLAFVLLMSVMRGLLRTATTLQSELDEVV